MGLGVGGRTCLASLGPSWADPPSQACLPTGPQLATVLGLGLGLLAPVATALALLLHHRAWRLPLKSECPFELSSGPSRRGKTPSCLLSLTFFSFPGGNSFRTPIQEEQADANSTLAKI